MELGLKGLLVAIYPYPCSFPPSFGGRTVGEKSAFFSTAENPHIIHKWEYCSIPRKASEMLYSGLKTISPDVSASPLCLGIPNFCKTLPDNVLLPEAPFLLLIKRFKSEIRKGKP